MWIFNMIIIQNRIIFKIHFIINDIIYLIIIFVSTQNDVYFINLVHLVLVTISIYALGFRRFIAYVDIYVSGKLYTLLNIPDTPQILGVTGFISYSFSSEILFNYFYYANTPEIDFQNCTGLPGYHQYYLFNFILFSINKFLMV